MLAFLGACSSSESSASKTPATADGGRLEETSLQCPRGTQAMRDVRACEGTLNVETLETTIAPVRDHHTTHVVHTTNGTYLYVVGGTDAWK